MSREINLKGWNNGESAAGFVAILLGDSPIITNQLINYVPSQGLPHITVWGKFVIASRLVVAHDCSTEEAVRCFNHSVPESPVPVVDHDRKID